MKLKKDGVFSAHGGKGGRDGNRETLSSALAALYRSMQNLQSRDGVIILFGHRLTDILVDCLPLSQSLIKKEKRFECRF